jgi:3-phytase
LYSTLASRIRRVRKIATQCPVPKREVRQPRQPRHKPDAPVDGRQLVADVEGLALSPKGRRGDWLVASSRGDNAHADYALPGLMPARRFRIAPGTFGSAEETDGIALVLGNFGPDYQRGLSVAQDDQNGAAAQNFKLVSWREALKALGE